MGKKWPSILIVAVGLSCYLSLSGCVSTQAESLPTEEKSTPIAIEILEKTLFFMDVTVPTFPSVTVDTEDQTVYATNDLVIGLKDTRIEGRSPWEVTYQLRVEPTDEHPPFLPKLSIGKGDVSTEKGPMSATAYTAKEIIAQPTSQSLLQVEETGNTTYEYRISKEDISLVVPKTVTEGTYRAKQIVQLKTIPNIP